MLRSLRDLERYGVTASDGDIGSVQNFLFDDTRWAIRYLVVHTGPNLGGRNVLVSPISFREVDWENQKFQLDLTVEKVKASPDVDPVQPVARQRERDLNSYYALPSYWGDGGVWGKGTNPGALAGGVPQDPPRTPGERPGDSHLRSAAEVRGYQLQGRDGALGQIEDFLVDDVTWEIRYLVLDTSSWWPGENVILSPHWATRVSWSERKIHLAIMRGAVKGSPEWIPTLPLNREYETRLYDYYGRPIYWAKGALGA